jgi:uncharacterized protein YodC (DUF2158 family)
MAVTEFEVGDLVRLKSGGPRMTVVGRMWGSDQLLCNWFEGVRSHAGSFPAKALAPAPEDGQQQQQGQPQSPGGQS